MPWNRRVAIATPGVSWYLSGGIALANCVLAYRAKGAASYAASKVNLNNPGTRDATDGTAYPTWDTGGWTFNGSSQFLHIPGSDASLKPITMLVRCNPTDFANYRVMFGLNVTKDYNYYFYITTGKQALSIGGVLDVGQSNTGGITGSSHVYAVTYSAAGAFAFYVDGAGDGSGTNDGAPIGGGTFDVGAQNGSLYWFLGSIQAMEILNIAATPTQVAALSTAMAAL